MPAVVMGYEREENDTRHEEMGVEAYIKPMNHEISKTRKYQRNRREHAL